MVKVQEAQNGIRLKACVRDCQECQQACLETAHYCLQRGGAQAQDHPVTLLFNASEICRIALDFILTGSTFHTWACGLAAEVCEKGAQECEAFSGDEKLALCAQACRQAARSCRDVAAVMKKG